MPLLSVRVFALLHQRTAPDAHERKRSAGVMVSLSWSPRATRHARAYRSLAFANPWSEPELCSDAALCAWAEAAEQVELYALGVLP